MKSKFYPLAFLIIASFILSSCKKWLPENRIQGTWKLVDAEKRRFLSNETFFTGYEKGVFSFYDNGDAVYADANGTMTGSWDMRKLDAGYYDQDGNWQQNNKTDLYIKLYDFRNNRVLEWYFDYIDFKNAGRHLTGYMNGASYNYRYYFTKQ